jgi:hypothetical protein
LVPSCDFVSFVVKDPQTAPLRLPKSSGLETPDRWQQKSRDRRQKRE